jgi:hypothetical protein
MKNVWKMLTGSIVLAGLMGLLPDSGFAAVVTFPGLLEGSTYRLVNPANGNDINNIVLGGLGICNPVVTVCDANTPGNSGIDDELNPRSDAAIWVAINDVTGARIGTRLLFCSDPASDAGDGAIPGCTDGLWANNIAFIIEPRAVGGIETIPYTPGANQPGFWPGNDTTYNLISDVPEPSSFMLIGTSLFGALSGFCVRRRRR